ncbi:MAG: sugar phosphate isomerase/epimerase [Firmicutes bacterium]|nr:sugar phosphate isomerase/epimerase [Bacillota bacterium]
MNVAVQLYTLREFTQTPAGIRETLHRVRALGYQAVQLSGLGPVDPGDLAQMVADAGLTVAATHVSWADLRDRFAQVVANHHLWECADTAIAAMPPEFRHPAGYREFARLASEKARALQAEGIRLSYHNHSFEFERVGDTVGLAVLFQAADPALQAEIDVYWVQHGGGDPAGWIERLAGRVPLVHLKDMTIVQGQQTMAEVGEGNLPWPRILAALAAAGTRWAMVEQDVCQRDPFESLALSLRHLQEWGVA